MNLRRFKIKQLHGSLNFDLFFKDNTLILLGENGSCKTTIIKILFYTLSLQWSKLSQYSFDSIEISFENDFVMLHKEDVSSIKVILNEGDVRMLPLVIRKAFRRLDIVNNKVDIQQIINICNQYDFPLDYLLNILQIETIDGKRQTNHIKHVISVIQHNLNNLQLLYLPTYRRIEQNLRTIFEDRIDDDFIQDDDLFPNIYFKSNNELYRELVEFGMDDVKLAIQLTMEDLKDAYRENLNQLTLSYLSDIVNDNYENVSIEKITAIDPDTIQEIMNRVDNRILSASSKRKLAMSLRKIIESSRISTDRDKVVCHYFSKLYDSHREFIETEDTIMSFIEKCNRYFNNKQMGYDRVNFDVFIKIKNSNKKISLSQLSSGEKQIVSIFNQVCLLSHSNYLVFIDEPELSLSVKWQRMFLKDIYNGKNCAGLIAVTHSPFVFDNELEKYAYGIGEFKN